jgi:hypothetical protein
MTTITLRHRRALALAATFALAGCESALLQDPAEPPAVLGVNFALAGGSAAGGPAAAFDKADSVHVAVFRASDFTGFEENFTDDWVPIGAIDVSAASFTPQAETRVRIEVDLENDIEPLVVIGALSRAREPLFAGLATFVARRGEVTSADVQLIPIPYELSLRTPPTITSLGDTVSIGAVVLFATDDTIPGFALTYTTSNPQIAIVDAGGRIVARGEGQAQIAVTASTEFFSLTRTVTVTIAATVSSIDVTPVTNTIDAGSSIQFTGVARDRRGNALVRTIAWSSSDPAVVSIDASGRATGLAAGSATITARIGTVTRSFNLTVRLVNSVVTGRVADAANQPIANATVTASLVGGAAGPPVNTDAQGNYSLTLQSNRQYLLAATAPGHSRQEVALTTVAAQHTVNFTLTLTTSRIYGEVINAVTRAPISGVTVSASNNTGVVASASTDAGGNYSLNVPIGSAYQVAADRASFISQQTTVNATAIEHNVDFVLSPNLGASQYRIVLTWGADPDDLDSHLFGPQPGGGRFQIFYNNRGSLTASPFAHLDTDDVDGFGPETITIAQQLAGRYTYSVHHFAGGGTLATSGALVRVFRGTQLIAQYSPPNQSGTIWNVFALDGATLTPIQTIGNAHAGSPVAGARSLPGLQADLTEAQRNIVESARLYRKISRLP